MELFIKNKKFNKPLFFMAMLGVFFLIVFAYIPMLGSIIAFKDMDSVLNIFRALEKSKFVGLENFRAFINDRYFVDIIFNTIGLNFLLLIITFPIPIVFALFLNEVRFPSFKKTIQSLTYLPYFISWVVFGGMMIGLLSVDGGAVNTLLMKFGFIDKPIPFASRPEYFWGVVIISSVIKGTGWGVVIYLAAISVIAPSIYEAAMIDGANRFQKMRFITLPGILGTIIIFLLLNISNLLNSSFDQLYILQNPLNLARSEVIDTYVYKIGIAKMRYAFSTAVGLSKSTIAFLLLTVSNYLSKRFLGRGLF